MAKAVLLVPREEMIESAKEVSGNYRLEFLSMKAVSAPEATGEAVLAVAAGAEMIIARGLSALEIKKTAQVPVVEILLTGQELGHLVMMVRQELDLPRPRIGIIGFRNMFSNVASYNLLYDVELHEYFVDRPEELAAATHQAHEDRMDALIGGDTVLRIAMALGLPAYFLNSGRESIAEAFRVAEQVSDAIEQEKKNTARFKTLLDYSFNGIIQISRTGVIEHVNHLVEKLLGLSAREMMGQPVSALIPDLGGRMLEQVLQRGEEVYSTLLTVNKTSVVTNLAPLLVDSVIQGAIVSFQEGAKITELEAKIRRGAYRAGHQARWTFSDFVAESEPSRELIETAKNLARYRAPVLILGEDGTEKEMLAQCIHNASISAGAPFVSISCDALPPHELTNWIFGSEKAGSTPYAPKGLVDMAENGVLFMDRISCLDAQAQYRLYRLVSEGMLIRNGDVRPLPAHARVIAADTADLKARVQAGDFRRELYHVLNTLPLTIIPLQQRPADLTAWAGQFIREMEQKYQRFVRLTAGASKLLAELPWDGSLAQIQSFCETMIIQSPRRSVDENLIRRIWKQAERSGYQLAQSELSRARSDSSMEDRIFDLLKQHRGNRRQVARALAISPTTLWRYMKKYGIEYPVKGMP